MAMYEKTLGTFAGEENGTRVQLVQIAMPGETPTLEMRLEVDCGELGWTTLRRIRLAAGQVPDLCQAINMMDPDARQATRPAKARAAERGLRLIG
jgi:hypothetical protein